MAYRLKLEESVAHGLRRLAKKEASALDKTLGRARQPGDIGIHRARKSLKKLRVIARLVQQDDGKGMRGSERPLKRINRILSRLRDATATLEIFSSLMQAHPHVLDRTTRVRVHKALMARRNRLFRAAAADGVWKELRRSVRTLRSDVMHWAPAHREFKALSEGLRAAHRDGRRARRAAIRRKRAEDFHELRKAIKTLWYEARLLELLGRPVRRLVTALNHAQSWLGDDHNIVVLCDILQRHTPPGMSAGSLARLQTMAARHQQRLRRKALSEVRAIYTERPARYVRRLKRAWGRAHAHD